MMIIKIKEQDLTRLGVNGFRMGQNKFGMGQNGLLMLLMNQQNKFGVLKLKQLMKAKFKFQVQIFKN